MKLVNLVISALFLSACAGAQTKGIKVLDETNDPDYLCFLGEDYLRGGLYDQAVEVFLKLYHMDKKNFCAVKNLGICYQSKGNRELAIDYYTKAVDRYPDFPKMHDDLGLLYQQLGRLTEAKEHFKIACNAGIKVSCDDLSRLEKEAVISAQPGTADFYYQEGKNFVTQGQYDKAIESYKKAVDIDKNHHQALNELGYEYEMKNMLDESYKYYQKCIEVKPDYGKCYDNLGFLYEKQGKYADSKKSFAKACELGVNEACADANKPVPGGGGGSFDSDYEDGVSLMNDKEYDSAIEAFKRSLDGNPCTSKTHEKIAEAYIAKKKYAFALDHLLRAVQINPSFGDAYYQLSIVYDNLGKKKDAAEAKKKGCDLGICK